MRLNHTFLFFCLLLTACASAPPTTPVLSWEEHLARILDGEDWALQGRLNVRGEQESNTVNINWLQEDGDFLINLSGTLGLGAVVISGDDRGVLLERSGEEAVSAASLSELGVDFLGYQFPAHALYYWVRGIPAPGGNPSIELNEQERLAALSQRDAWGNTWSLEFDRYQSSNGIELPGRIIMHHPDYRLTFLISDWQVGPPTES